MENTQILGFYVTRSKHGRCKKPVWAGFTSEERENHKKFILEKVSRHEYDGETSFEDVESPVKLSVDDVFWLNGDRIRVAAIKGVFVTGYIQKMSQKTNKFKDKFVWHGYINGTSI